jgi:hypothetical protein
MSADVRARALLQRMRETPMRRGALSPAARQLRADLATTLAQGGVPDLLAQRVAFQLVIKLDPDELNDPDSWPSIAVVLCEEMATLIERVGLAERQLITLLPKLSAVQIEQFHDELMRADRRIARTLANATFTAGMPLGKAMEHLQKFLTSIARQKDHPDVARLLARAGFYAD